MTTQTVTIERSKLKLALDAFIELLQRSENFHTADVHFKDFVVAKDAMESSRAAITAIKEALAVDKESLTTEAQQSNEQGCEHCNHSLYCGTKCKNCGKQSNEQVEPVAWVQDVELEQSPEFAFSWVETRLHNVPLYTHPPVPTAQPEQDKERCVGCDACIDTACGRDECPKGWPKAPQRTWVGLTEQEAAECWSTSTVRTWQAIEAKLKEKNTK